MSGNKVVSCDLAYYFALWRIGKLPPERIPETAAEALDSGWDSPSLRKLAGLHKPTSADIGDLFECAMVETGLHAMSNEKLSSRLSDEWLQNAIPVARHIATQITNGEIDVAEGWLSLPYREGNLGPLEIFFEGFDPGSSVEFDEEFRTKTIAAARKFLAENN